MYGSNVLLAEEEIEEVMERGGQRKGGDLWMRIDRDGRELSVDSVAVVVLD